MTSHVERAPTGKWNVRSRAKVIIRPLNKALLVLIMVPLAACGGDPVKGKSCESLYGKLTFQAGGKVLVASITGNMEATYEMRESDTVALTYGGMTQLGKIKGSQIDFGSHKCKQLQ